MILKVLMDNEPDSPHFVCEHGLSLLLQSGGREILFDFGQSEEMFRNAKRLCVDVTNVDYAILSHGHYDHGGGLNEFLRRNERARIYLRPGALGRQYSLEDDGQMESIGLRSMPDMRRVVQTGDRTEIEPGALLFTAVAQPEWEPSGNRLLFTEGADGGYARDSFEHEQYLLLNDKGRQILVTGCAHKGIVTILRQAHAILGKYPDVVIGGLHLGMNADKDEAAAEKLSATIAFLKATGALFLTGHCTGRQIADRLIAEMPGRAGYAGAGKVLEI